MKRDMVLFLAMLVAVSCVLPVKVGAEDLAAGKTAAKAAPKIDPAYVGLWQYPGHTVWIEIKADGSATQCRIDKGDANIYRATGKVTGDKIVWNTLWGTDRIKALPGAIVLQGKYGTFHYVTALDAEDESCKDGAPN